MVQLLYNNGTRISKENEIGSTSHTAANKIIGKASSCYTEGRNTRSEDRKVATTAVLADGEWMLEP